MHTSGLSLWCKCHIIWAVEKWTSIEHGWCAKKYQQWIWAYWFKIKHSYLEKECSDDLKKDFAEHNSNCQLVLPCTTIPMWQKKSYRWVKITLKQVLLPLMQIFLCMNGTECLIKEKWHWIFSDHPESTPNHWLMHVYLVILITIRPHWYHLEQSSSSFKTKCMSFMFPNGEEGWSVGPSI